MQAKPLLQSAGRVRFSIVCLHSAMVPPTGWHKENYNRIGVLPQCRLFLSAFRPVAFKRALIFISAQQCQLLDSCKTARGQREKEEKV